MPFDLIFPSSPHVGQVYKGPTGISWSWDGIKWIARGRSQTSKVFIGKDPPNLSDVEPGDLWFDPVSIQLFVWYVDPTTAQWVVTVNQSGWGAGLDDAPQDGIAYLRQDGDWVALTAFIGIEEAPQDGKKYVRIDGEWQELDEIDGGIW